mgnify:CR=1 FL=1
MEQNNLKIVGDFNKMVDIRIEGKRYDITGLGANDFTASIDLSQIRAKGSSSIVGKTLIETTIQKAAAIRKARIRVL